jgi:hypothetical protein
MSKVLQHQLTKAVKGQGDMAREMALAELKDLKKDLLTLEKALTSKKSPDQALLMDIAHGAFELFRTASIVLETDTLQDLIIGASEASKDLTYLESKGAIQLTSPEGWHWFSPKGEMIFLAPSTETKQAATKLRQRLTRKPRPKAATTKPKEQPQA